MGDGGMKKCTECGHCCVIFNLVRISKFEAKLRGLKTERTKSFFPEYEDKNELRLKRKRVFWGAIGKWIYVCEYFDIDTRLCSIYQNRPDICRKYVWCEQDKRVQSEWEALIRGENAQCLRT